MKSNKPTLVILAAGMGSRYGGLKAEFYIALVINQILKSSKATVEVLKSDAKWFGVTYREDKEIVQNAIMMLKDKGTYPTNLW